MSNITEKANNTMISDTNDFQDCLNKKDFGTVVRSTEFVEMGVSLLFDPVKEMKDYFIARVILDGRYLDTFTEQPELVAKHLNVVLDPVVAEELRNEDTYELLHETTDRWAVTNGYFCDPVAGPAVWIAATVVAGIVAGTFVYTIYPICRADEIVFDRSAEADAKL